ncbi:MAG: hypothetical protein FJ202_01215 [Gemmatimonadetes bacterium]|nr:hypothetical protein [Gemmatimonadota bacterium]
MTSHDLLRLGVSTVAAVAWLAACSGDSGTPPQPATGASTSFARLQSQVLVPSCSSSSCHAPGSSSGSGLALSGSDAYSQLVNALPKHPTARADGLKLVAPGKPDSSLLWHKVNGFVASHHAKDYGAAMPYAGQQLPAGQIEFMRQWIVGGASATTDNVNPELLNGTFTPASYAPLAAPAGGFQVKMPAFPVQRSSEREVFLYAPVGNTQEVWVNRIQTNMRTGSHHFVLYTFQPNTPSLILPPVNQLRDLRDANGTYVFTTVATMGYHVFFAGSQGATGDYTFPSGVAIRLAANSQIDVNSHYVNSTPSTLTGEAEANLYTVPASQVQFEAKALNLNTTDLTIPAGRDTTIVKTFRFNTITRVVMLTSHMHKRGLRYVIKISGGARNGEVVYTNEHWDHPLIQAYSTPIVLNPGEGLTSEVTYRGDPSKVVRFGLTAEDEMNIIFGYWY